MHCLVIRGKEKGKRGEKKWIGGRKNIKRKNGRKEKGVRLKRKLRRIKIVHTKYICENYEVENASYRCIITG